MKKILVFTIIFTSLTYSCSKESVDETPDPSDRWGEWSAWTPEFSNQTADFTQSRSRSVIVNGDRDSNAPSGDANETRNISVTSSTETQTDNERSTTFDNDLNGDGDFVDYVQRTITTYTASNGLGSHSVNSDWTVSIDQDEYFYNLNYGDWGDNISDSDGDYLYTYLLQLRDTVDETKQGTMDTESGETCFTMETVQEAIDAIPYDDYSIGDDTSTQFDFTLFDIDFGQWIGDSDFDGVLVDYEVVWVTADQAGNQVIGISEKVYIAFSAGGTYSDDDVLASLTGVISRLSTDVDYDECSSTSGKSFKNKTTSIEYLLNNIDTSKLQ